jgi:hypothetical protein
MERELGISYPTVRGRLETLLRALDLGDGPAVPVQDDEEPISAESAAPEPAETGDETATERRIILERLSRHELSAEEAAAAIRALGAR